MESAHRIHLSLLILQKSKRTKSKKTGKDVRRRGKRTDDQSGEKSLNSTWVAISYCDHRGSSKMSTLQFTAGNLSENNKSNRAKSLIRYNLT